MEQFYEVGKLTGHTGSIVTNTEQFMLHELERAECLFLDTPPYTCNTCQ